MDQTKIEIRINNSGKIKTVNGRTQGGSSKNNEGRISGESQLALQGIARNRFIPVFF